MLLFDAVDCDREPGTLVVARDAEVPRYMNRDKMSLHQAGMNDVLASLEMLGHRPQSFTLVGVQPVELADYGGSLTPRVRELVPRALELGLAELAAWGVVAHPRGTQHGSAVVSDAIAVRRYEDERPSEEAAYRRGDERFLNLPSAGRPAGDDPGKPR